MEDKMNNMPEMKVGIVAVSRDCFPESLSVNRRENLVNAYTQKYGKDDIYECPICIVESEIHMQQALEDIKKAGCNALCVYLGNFGTTGSLLEKSRPVSVFQPPFFTAVLKIKSRSAVNGTALKEFRHQSR